MLLVSSHRVTGRTVISIVSQTEICSLRYVLLSQGVNVGLFSPTLPDIELLTSSSTSQVSMTLIWAGIASVGGTLAIGPLFDRLNGFLLLTICLTMQAIAISLAPLWPSLVAYQALSAIAFIFNFALMSGMITGCRRVKGYSCISGPSKSHRWQIQTCPSCAASLSKYRRMPLDNGHVTYWCYLSLSLLIYPRKYLASICGNRALCNFTACASHGK